MLHKEMSLFTRRCKSSRWIGIRASGGMGFDTSSTIRRNWVEGKL